MNDTEAKKLVESTLAKCFEHVEGDVYRLRNDLLDEIFFACDTLDEHVSDLTIHVPYDCLWNAINPISPYLGLKIAHRMWEAMSRFEAIERGGRWLHKGLPLVRLWDSAKGINEQGLANRFGILTLIEDALRDMPEGGWVPEKSGAYGRAQIEFGWTKADLDRFGHRVFDAAKLLCPEFPSESAAVVWTERVLMKLFGDPEIDGLLASPTNDSKYFKVRTVSSPLLRWSLDKALLEKDVNKKGRMFEEFAGLCMSQLPGAIAQLDVRGLYQADVLVSLAWNRDLKDLFGDLVIVECKNHQDSADINVPSKLFAAMALADSRTGILFAPEGLTGEGTMSAATGVLRSANLKSISTMYLFDKNDCQWLADGGSTLELLLRKQTEGRLGDRS